MPENRVATLPVAREPDGAAIDVDVAAAPIAAGPSECMPIVRGAVPVVRRGWFENCDPLALASAACGLTALIPVVSQVLGLVLGVSSLIRIRSARRQGLVRRGTGWAWAGIVSSGFMLLVWGFVVAVLLAVGGTFARVAGTLPVGS